MIIKKKICLRQKRNKIQTRKIYTNIKPTIVPQIKKLKKFYFNSKKTKIKQKPKIF